MSRLRLAHVPLVLAAIARWLLGTNAGRKVLACGAGATGRPLGHRGRVWARIGKDGRVSARLKLKEQWNAAA